MPYPRKSPAFVFEDWRALAEKDPQAFEEQRQHMIDSLIASAPRRHRTRLERLQWRIDMERKRSSNPLAACVRISSMMLDAVYGEAGLVSALKGDFFEELDSRKSARVFSIAQRRQTEGQD